MKLTYSNNEMKIEVTNPDERIRGHFADRFREAVAREIDEFLQECQVAFRKLEPGQTVKLTSRPITVEISCEAEQESEVAT